jgi:hypothetical protein
MTGAFVRVYRNGTWQNIEFDQLTDSEMYIFAEEHPEDGWKWAMFLGAWIRNNIKEEAA